MEPERNQSLAVRWLTSFKSAAPQSGTGMARILILSMSVGAIAGLAAVALCSLLELTQWALLGKVAGIAGAGASGEPEPFHSLGWLPDLSPSIRRWVLLILPALAGLATGWFVWKLAPEAAGGGTDSAIESYHFRGGKVRARVIPVKALATATIIGSGGSAGCEGPITQIGAGVGSMVSEWFDLPASQRRVLMAAGMGAGMGALFHAPLAGALFAAEIFYRDLDLEYEVLVPSIIASVTGYTLFSKIFGFHPLFDTPQIVFARPENLILYIALAVVLAFGARFYTWSFYSIHGAFLKAKKVPQWVRPALGGLATGLIGMVFLGAIGSGYGSLQQALHFNSEYTIGAKPLVFGSLLAIFVLKSLATAFTVGSGGSGGVFGPSLVVGGALGGAVGMLFATVLPGWGVPVGAFVLVGMVAFFGCAAKTPISSILMVSEMTGNYRLLVPSMWVCIIAYLLSRKVSLYRSQLPNRFEAPVHRGSVVSGTLGAFAVRDLLSARGNTHGPLLTVRRDTPVASLMEMISDSNQELYPVMSKSGTLAGAVGVRDIQAVLSSDPILMQTLLVEDLAIEKHPVVTEGELLRSVLAKMDADNAEAVIVVDEAGSRPVGLVTHNDVAAAYQAEIEKAR